MAELSYHRETCRLCNSPAVECVVPLRPIPVATPNIDIQAVAQGPEALRRHTVPLDLYLCRECGHFQLLDIVNPEVQYTHFRYTTSISLGLPEHFRHMARDVVARTAPPPGSLVLEIGSNDGTLLRAFQEVGLPVLGVDPAARTAELATASGVETLAAFFTTGLARDIRQTRGSAGIVVCNNTLANIDTAGDLIDGVREVLAPEGVFVFETSYGADVVRNTLIDTVYHEHLSYFLVRPLERFFRAHGLELYDVDHIWTKGGSIRGYVQHAGGPRPRGATLDRMIAAELAGGFDRPEQYAGFGARIETARRALSDSLDRHGTALIGGYGASVGTVTLVHQFDLTQRLGVLFDDKPLSSGLVGPDYNIPIVHSDEIYTRHPEAVVILAWRYADPIRSRHRRYLAEGGRFLMPLPVESPACA